MQRKFALVSVILWIYSVPITIEEDLKETSGEQGLYIPFVYVPSYNNNQGHIYGVPDSTLPPIESVHVIKI